MCILLFSICYIHTYIYYTQYFYYTTKSAKADQIAAGPKIHENFSDSHFKI